MIMYMTTKYQLNSQTLVYKMSKSIFKNKIVDTGYAVTVNLSEIIFNDSTISSLHKIPSCIFINFQRTYFFYKEIGVYTKKYHPQI